MGGAKDLLAQIIAFGTREKTNLAHNGIDNLLYLGRSNIEAANNQKGVKRIRPYFAGTWVVFYIAFRGK